MSYGVWSNISSKIWVPDNSYATLLIRDLHTYQVGVYGGDGPCSVGRSLDTLVGLPFRSGTTVVPPDEILRIVYYKYILSLDGTFLSSRPTYFPGKQHESRSYQNLYVLYVRLDVILFSPWPRFPLVSPPRLSVTLRPVTLAVSPVPGTF